MRANRRAMTVMWASWRAGAPKAVTPADGEARAIRLPRRRPQVPTGGLYLSGHHFFMWQTPCARRAAAGVRWGAAGSLEAAPKRRKGAQVPSWRTSHGVVATFSGGKPIFFLLPAMKLLPAHPRRRRHPEGRSAAEEARSALPSAPRMGTMPSSCRKQENHVSFFPGPSGVRGTEGPYLTNLLADPPGATNRRCVS